MSFSIGSDLRRIKERVRYQSPSNLKFKWFVKKDYRVKVVIENLESDE